MHGNPMRLALENQLVDVTQPSHDDALIMSFRKEFGHLYPTPPVIIEHNPLGRPYLAMEEVANGAPVKEIEHTIYAKVVNQSDLERAASKESQEQWEIRIEKTGENAGKGSTRVRKSWQEGKEDEASYVQTFKISMNEAGDKIEIPMPSNKDMFTAFKFLGSKGMRKDRYVFPILGTDLKWEVDMFLKPDGSGYYDWCKIDLEVRDRSQPIPELPIPLTDVILPEGMGRPVGGNEEGQIRALYDEFFLKKNEFLEKPSTDPAIGSEPQQSSGLNTSEQATLPNDPGAQDDSMGKPVVSAAGSDDAPGTPDTSQVSAAPSSTAEVPEHEKLNQTLNEGQPDNLQAPPEEQQSDQGQGTPEDPTQQQESNDTSGAAIPDEPNGAEPNGGSTTPEQAAGNQNSPDEAPMSDAEPQPSEDDSADATDPASDQDAGGGETEAEQQIEQNEQTQKDVQDQTQLKVDQIQKNKQAEAASQGKPDPTEGGKVPVDLIDNPQGDPSVAEDPDNTGENTDGDDTTGAGDGTNPEDNGEGTGDGLGGDLAGGAGTTGTDDDSIGMDPNAQGAPDDTPDGEAGMANMPADGSNSEGQTNAEVNGEDNATAAAPDKAAGDELPAENQDQRPKEGEQAQQ